MRRTHTPACGDFAAHASRSLTGLAAIVGLALASTGPVLAQTIDESLWVTNGRVGAVVRAGGTIYLGGKFTRVGPATGGGVPLDATTGALPPSFPKVRGWVSTVVSDGEGGWYVGGTFAVVGGSQRSNIAHVNSDLSVTAWNPGANGGVYAMESIGSTLYVSGSFTSIGGQARNGLAALDAGTGAATDWSPIPPGDHVNDFAVSGSTVYVCGHFTSIGGQPRSCIAALDAATGAVTDWDPSATGADLPETSSPYVNAVAVSGSTVYAGGWFSGIGGQPRNFIAALDSATGLATAWNPNADFWVEALEVNGPIIYAGGMFSTIGGQSRSAIAALDVATGAATAWNPNAQGNGGPGGPYTQVLALEVIGSTVYAGGSFSGIGGQTRDCIAALDALTGAATSWSANASSPVGALAVSGSRVYAGGGFASIGAKARNNLAALNAETGAATNWNPNANGEVAALAVSGSIVYAGGYFNVVDGRARNNLAALDAATGGVITAWNPNASGGGSHSPRSVAALAVSGSTVYSGGNFGNVGGQPRNNIAALDAASGLATVWNPNADGPVYALTISGSTVYAGGGFHNIGGQGRSCIAALDATSGQATAWNPNSTAAVRALAVSGTNVYVGGYFSGIGGQTRWYLAALDAATGAATGWNPSPDLWVYALAVNGSTVYASGQFTRIGGQARDFIAALDAVTGAAATAWNPGARPVSYGLAALAVSGSTVYVGGDFSMIGGLPHTNIAAIGDVTTPTLISVVSARALPNRVEITWHAPAGDVAGATVYRRSARNDWTPVGTIWPDGTGRLVYGDTQVIAGTRYGYRLGVMEAGQEVFLGETWVDVPLAAKLALALRSNPSPREVTVAFTLPDASPARLEVFDLAGRRLAAREIGSLGAGDHVLSLGSGAPLPPGTYVLRLSQRDHTIHARGVILR